MLTLDSPPMNTFGIDAIKALKVFFQQCAEDRPLLITGRGSAFSAGVDTKLFASYDSDQRAQLFQEITNMTSALVSIPAPVIAAINGHALGGGLVVALCCDYRLAVDGDHKFGLTEASAGIPFPAGPVEVIANELPCPLLRRLTLTSRVISAQELAAQGIIDELHESSALLASAKHRAREISGQLAFRQVKEQIRGRLAERLVALVKS